jgi:hypothetical protein
VSALPGARRRITAFAAALTANAVFKEFHSVNLYYYQLVTNSYYCELWQQSHNFRRRFARKVSSDLLRQGIAFETWGYGAELHKELL